ncbi:neurofilament medium polypeptide-like [Neocloeon triangulifer]|uniref:neurofilament medium polypeptide-like n=1 Tax=Neocloeon triangulifer TaxID=2078957 RepID=UPI00286F9073|nr:neurofilament medium polypeptide-like [Neocloeon triangulifer]
MDYRRQNRSCQPSMGVGGGNTNGNRPYVKLDRITQIPSPFHNSGPSPYSRRMPYGHGPPTQPMQHLVGSPYQIFSPRTQQQNFPGLPPVPPYPFHNLDLTPRRRQGPVTRSKSALRPTNKQSRLSVKPAPRPQLSTRAALAPSTSRQENKLPKPAVTKQSKPPEKAAKAVEKQSKAAEKPTKQPEKPRRESWKPEPTRRRSLAPLVRSGTDFIERNKINAARRKSVDPSALKDMKTTRRQSLPRIAKAVRVDQSAELEEKHLKPKVEEPAKSEPEPGATVEEVIQVSAEKPKEPKEDEVDEAKENLPEEPSSPKRARVEISDAKVDEPNSPEQPTSLFLQYLDIKKEDLPNIVADYETQSAPVVTKEKESKKQRCAIM